MSVHGDEMQPSFQSELRRTFLDFYSILVDSVTVPGTHTMIKYENPATLAATYDTPACMRHQFYPNAITRLSRGCTFSCMYSSPRNPQQCCALQNHFSKHTIFGTISLHDKKYGLFTSCFVRQSLRVPILHLMF
jgi:hypothetical protein